MSFGVQAIKKRLTKTPNALHISRFGQASFHPSNLE
jgi:hypothetical protein